MPTSTSWGKVSGWYEEHLSGSDTYHTRVVLPNLLRLMDIAKGDNVLDLACGTGFFAAEFRKAGAKVVGADISPELIAKAKKAQPEGDFFAAPSHELGRIASGSIAKISCVLAIQNIEQVKKTFTECSRVLAPGGRLFLVMNHPAFRIPKHSAWGVDSAGKEYRRVDAYMSEKAEEITMNPGDVKSATTVSFHRPLQYYFKLLEGAGFSVARLEEWISHKKSAPGPRKAEEDRMRKEIPLFLALVAEKK